MADSKEEVISLPVPPPLAVTDENPCHRRFWWISDRGDGGPDQIATQPSVFDDPLTLEVYRPPEQYENSHKFDPYARWTWREESIIVRKTDLRIMPLIFAMLFVLTFDSSSLSRANTDNFLQDLHLTTDDFNFGLTLSHASLLVGELPLQLISKRIGPDIWIPMQITLWSIVSISQFWLNGRTFFLVTRLLIGLLSSGFLPSTVLYLSYFYTRRELPIRLAWISASAYLSILVGGFTSTGILLIHSGHGAWRYIFLIEGLIMFSTGIASRFFMPPGPTQTKTWFRPRGWFTDREEIIIVNRLLRDDPTKSDMHNRQGITLLMIWESLCDWRMWPLYILGFTYSIPTTPPQNYMSLILRHAGFTTTQTNLLSLPGFFLGFLTLLAVTHFSERVQSRVLGCLVLPIWAMPLLIALRTFGDNTNRWDYYVVLTLISGSPTITAIGAAWVSTNSGSVRTRLLSSSVRHIFFNAGTLVSANLYRADDAPLYKQGNVVLICICCANIVLHFFIFVFYRTINRYRDRKWNAMTEKEQADYLQSNRDKGNGRLDFRFVY